MTSTKKYGKIELQIEREVIKMKEKTSELRDFLEFKIGCGRIEGTIDDLLDIIHERHKNGSELTVEEVLIKFARKKYYE